MRSCRWLLGRGVDINVLNHNGHSALHKAAVKGRRDVCEWLLAEGGLGVRHLQPDGDGNTPALMARFEGHAALSEWLDATEQGLRHQHRNQVGPTPD